MALRRALVVFGSLASSIIVIAPGCQDPTQVTLELTLDKKATCAEIPSGTAITIGVEPFDTETRVASGFVTARTTDCDSATNRIGTLVVTPSDPGKASVVVVVGYKNNDPTLCKPPRYDGCIVARRRFAFAEHTRLRMPITIDPDCAGVPCDAFSTCNKGRCYDSETSCTGTECERPGVLEDGGVDEAGVVEPDASGFDSGPGPVDSGPTDSGPFTDADSGPVTGPDAGPGTSCAASNTMVCSGVSCGGGVCCGNGPDVCMASCAQPTDQYCCVGGAQDSCPAGYRCVRPSSTPGTCQPAVSPEAGTGSGPYCMNGGLYCSGSQLCSALTNACCSVNGGSPGCSPSATCMGQTRYCCSNADCSRPDGGTGTCLLGVVASPDQRFSPQPIPIGATNAGTCQ